jgi:hypothetical protein
MQHATLSHKEDRQMIDSSWATKIKTDADRINTMVEFLTENHLDNHGGYPHDSIWIKDTLIIADLDDGKERARTMIVTYKKDTLIKWCKRAEKAKKDWWPNEDFATCLWETYPKSRNSARTKL